MKLSDFKTTFKTILRGIGNKAKTPAGITSIILLLSALGLSESDSVKIANIIAAMSNLISLD